MKKYIVMRRSEVSENKIFIFYSFNQAVSFINAHALAYKNLWIANIFKGYIDYAEGEKSYRRIDAIERFGNTYFKTYYSLSIEE